MCGAGVPVTAGNLEWRSGRGLGLNCVDNTAGVCASQEVNRLYSKQISTTVLSYFQALILSASSSW